MEDSFPVQLSENMICLGASHGGPWLMKGHTVILFSDPQKMRDLVPVPNFPRDKRTVLTMGGWGAFKDQLEAFKRQGALYVAIDPPPKQGAKINPVPIDDVIADLQHILAGREDLCPNCKQRLIECRCGVE